jgi:uncharacterized protein YvpB
VAAGAALMLLMVSQLMPVGRVAASNALSVDSWIELSGTTPAAGCAISGSVEVRNGGGVEGVEVLMALYVDRELISADRVVTDSNGIAFLAVDASPADGANAWLDVVLNNTYWWGTPVYPGKGSNCNSGYLLESKSGAIDAAQYAAGDTASETYSGSNGDGSFIPEVGFYVQQRNLSCEYAALYIATSAWYNPISEYAFDELVGWSANPHWGYRGDINGWWGNTTDYGVYAAPLAAALSAFGFRGDAFYADGNADALTSRIDAGIPTLVWLSLWGDLSYVDYADGSPFTLVPGMHVVVAYGYDEGGVYVSDPAIGGARYYDWGTFMYFWGVLDGMGLGVSPA